jgi:excisionase family DNA binding protein
VTTHDSYITTREAANKLGVTSLRRVKQLIDTGKLKATKVAPGDYPSDARVRTLVSVGSLNALLRNRGKRSSLNSPSIAKDLVGDKQRSGEVAA